MRVHAGDLRDADSVARAAKGADAVFLMADFRAGPGEEVRAGSCALEGLRAAGVGHVVYSSVASADRRTGIPHFESKHWIEELLRRSGLPHTVVAPVFFMDNPKPSLAATGGTVLAMPLAETTVLQQVAVRDIGAFVRHVLEHPDEVVGERIEIAGDALTGPQAAAVLSCVTGRPVRYQAIPACPDRFGPDIAAMFAWLDRVGYQVDIPALHARFPGIGWHTFEAWARDGGVIPGSA